MSFTSGTIDVISMGCSKNLVDSERLIMKLKDIGYTLRHDPKDVKAEYVVVNTCGFIADAKEESIQLILELAELKKEGKVGKLVVMGCLSERYMEEIKLEIPEVDIWYGKYDWKNFIKILPLKTTKSKETKSWERELTTPASSAYLKISEGCNRFCAFCAIPIITGKHKSRSIEEIVEETQWLVKRGVKEFNVIAQDLSSYGLDLYGEQKLAELIDRMADVEGVEWIRLHYAYPAQFPMDILDVMARRNNVCKYLDIALQHISDDVLTNMRRKFSGAQTRELISIIRRRVPGIRLRTTLMVGFPGETEEAFEELLDFVKEAKFDRMGAFAYSEEDDTWAAKNLDDNIPHEVKADRLNRLMDIQEQIAQELNNDFVGTKMKVLVDRIEDNVVIARSEYDSPDVDPEILVYNSHANPGDFIWVKITDSYPFELIGEEI